MSRLISIIILLALSSVSLNAVGANMKQQLCHDGKTIIVSKSAVSAHLGHGDLLGSCSGTWQGSDEPAAVVMMRCEVTADNGMTVMSVTASFDYASIQPVEPVDCALAMATLLDAGFHLRSVTSGSAGATDYLFLGRVPAEG